MTWAAAIPILGSILDRVIPDKNARAQAQEALEAAEQSGELQVLLGQLEINKQEAAHKSIFVAGARPFILWVCGVALLYNTLLHPILNIWVDMPPVETGLLYPVLTGMLGLGGMRSWEKSKGVARESL